MLRHLSIVSSLVALLGVVLPAQSLAATILGTGTGALVGSDLTDVGDDGNEGAYAPPNLAGFDAVFFANQEPGFGGGEFSFNVFDNRVGGGNDKACCNNVPYIIGADFSTTLATGTDLIQLERFTLTSSNDSPGRDPAIWSIEGSTDTTDGLDGTWTPIFESTNPTTDWTARNQVVSYSPGDGDAFLTTDGFKAFRLNTTAVAGGTAFALGEFELFGQVVSEPPPPPPPGGGGGVPEPTSVALWLLIGLGAGGFRWWRVRRKK